MRLIICILSVVCFNTFAGERVVQEDPILGKQPHKQQWELKDGKLCPVDIHGNREYHKPCLVITKGK